MKSKVFSRSGAVADPSDIFDRKQGHEEVILKSQMRKEGYVPNLDVCPEVSVSPIEGKGTYAYTVSMTGSYIGDKAWRYDGIMKEFGLIRRTRSSK